MSFAGENSKSAKSIDCALVIAGWPIVYTVARGDYAIPSTAQDSTTLSSANGLTTIHSWANLPDSVGESAKGRPEEGSFTIAQIDVDVLDRYANGGRELSNLLSRQAYLDAAIARLNQVTDAPTTPAGCAATLTASVSTTDTILRVSGSPDITQLSVTGGIVYVGL